MLRSLLIIVTLLLSIAAWSDDHAQMEAALEGQSAETVQAARDFLAENPMDQFDAKRLKRLRKKHGEVFANDVYAEWIDSKNLGTDCSTMIGSCDYYLCRENIQPCGVSGYYLAFGYQYCQKSFNNLSSRVSPKGQQWLIDVATCLQQKVESDIQPDMACNEIKKNSIASHESCYKETNFCQQKFKDVLKVIGMLSPELAKPRMIILGINIIKNCVF